MVYTHLTSVLAPLMSKIVEQGVFYINPPATPRSPINQNATMAKDDLLIENVISAERVRKTSRLSELFGLVACASSPICSHTLIGQHDLAAANGWASSDNCSPARLLIAWLSDLELWRDIRVSKIECARRCGCARVSQPNASAWRAEFSVGDWEVTN